jgi:hypothetical protein
MDTTAPPIIRPDPNAKAMIRDPSTGSYRYETDAEFADYMARKLAAAAAPKTTEILSVSVGKRPAVKAQEGGFVFVPGPGGVQTTAHRDAVKAKPEGSLSVCIFAMDLADKGAAYVDAETATKFANDILDQVLKLKEAMQAAEAEPKP